MPTEQQVTKDRRQKCPTSRHWHRYTKQHRQIRRETPNKATQLFAAGLEGTDPNEGNQTGGLPTALWSIRTERLSKPIWAKKMEELRADIQNTTHLNPSISEDHHFVNTGQSARSSSPAKPQIFFIS